jgi:glycosyltransferase involved in cell wall biosynthesis
MKIAQVAPLYESVPPKFYGGTERVVSYLTEELVRLGHEVTLFASGDSVTTAELVPVCQRALRLDRNCLDQLAHHVLLLEHVFKRAHEFEIVHFHIDYLHFPLSRRNGTSNLTTLHGRLDLPDLVPLYEEFGTMNLVSISDAQRHPLRWVNWLGTVYHGLPAQLYKLHEEPGDYLAFIGRISPEKGIDRAIEIARRAQMPLKLAAKVDRADRDYFEGVIKPLLGGPLVEYVGEIGEDEKDEFLGHAFALLFPVDWPEPFGLAMIEAMACGTPVIAFRRGSVPEVVDEAQTGFIVNDVEGAVQALHKVPRLSRKACRQVFEARFTASRMAREYLTLYEQILARDANPVLAT